MIAMVACAPVLLIFLILFLIQAALNSVVFQDAMAVGCLAMNTWVLIGVLVHLVSLGMVLAVIVNPTILQSIIQATGAFVWFTKMAGRVG